MYGREVDVIESPVYPQVMLDTMNPTFKRGWIYGLLLIQGEQFSSLEKVIFWEFGRMKFSSKMALLPLENEASCYSSAIVY